VTLFAVHADWCSPDAVGDETLLRISSAFRPTDEGVCLLVAPGRPTILSLDLDVEAIDAESALGVGREAIAEAAALGALAGAPERVVAMTDEESWEWLP
jgi:hypothetical protein